MSLRRAVATLATVAVLAGIALPGTAVAAQNTIQVTTSVDDPTTATAAHCPGPACSLRDAVAAADASSTPVTIDVPAGIYVLTGPALQVGTAAGAAITLLGAGGAGATVVKQTYADRVLNVDPSVDGNVSVTVQNLSLTGGSAGGYGGGGILAGGPSDALSIVSSAVYGNTSSTNGGGIAFEGGGTLTMQNSTISDNSAPAGDGGGVFTSQAAALNVTGSTFTGNTVAGVASGGGQGGGMFVSVLAGGAADISTSTFTANQADGDGGGLFVASGAPALSLDRIAGNTAPAGSGVYNGGPIMAATDVWWGCNAGPDAPGCDTVDGNATTNPWMVLQAGTVASSVYSGETLTATADMTHDSSGGTPGALPDGTPVAFSSSLGSLSPSSAGLASGQASSTFTAGATLGLATLSVSVDSQTVTVPVTILATVAPTVTTQPAATYTCAGGPATFTAAASGAPAPTVQWQRSTDGGASWQTVAGATYGTLQVAATTAAENGELYRAVFANPAGSAPSDPAPLGVDTPVTVTQQPADASAVATASVSFSAAGGGSSNIQTQWQVSTDGGSTWTAIAGAASGTLQLTAAPADSGNQYRAVLTDRCGSVPTHAATLSVSRATPAIAWTPPAPVADGTPLGQAQLDASASFGGVAVYGAFTYTVGGQPAAGLTLPPGSYTIDAAFAPSDSTEFTSATAHVPLTVLPPPTVTGLDWTASPQTGFLASTWTLTFTTSVTGALTVGQAVYVTAPAGTVLPGLASDYTLNGTVAGAVYGGGSSVRATLPVALAASTAVTLRVAGVVNPPDGTYPAADLAVSTSADTIPASPSGSLVFAPLPDGSGAVSVAPGTVVVGSAGNTLTFTFTAGADGTVAGAVYLAVPTAWGAPGAGSWTASQGQVSVSGQTVAVSDITLAPQHRLTIVDAGAVAPATPGPSDFEVSEASSAGGTPQALAPAAVDVVTPLAPPAGSLPDATLGTAYNQTPAATGGTPPYTFALSGGALPAGLSLDTVTGAVYGIPTVVGTATARVTVTDSSSPPLTATGSVTVMVVAAPQLTVTTTVLPGAAAGAPYTATLAAAGGIAPYRWSLAPGAALPAGLSLSPSGQITGTPLAAGAAAIGVEVADSGRPGQTASGTVALLIGPAGGRLSGSSGATATSSTTAAVAGGTGSPTPLTTATASGGTGTVLTGSYTGDPVGAGLSVSGSATYFDVALVPGSTFTQVIVQQCGLQPGASLRWWSGTGWQPVVAPQTFASGCLTMTLTTSTQPSLADLAGTVFAAVEPVPQGLEPNGGGAPATVPTGTTVGTRGGTLTTSDGAFAATVPPGVVPTGQTLGVEETRVPPVGLPAGLQPVSATFTVTGPTLSAPISVTLKVASRTGEAGAWAVYAEGTGGTWRSVPARVSAAVGTVTVDVSGPATLVVVGPSALPADVPVGYWAAPAIGSLLAAGVVSGFPDGTFRPGEAVTRAEFVKMLDLVLGLKVAGGQTPFTDVAAGAWYAPYVAAAVGDGLVEGTSPTTFSPDAPLTRQEMAVLLARALKLSATAALHFSDDGQIAGWALPGVEAAVAGGLMAGYPDGSFLPEVAATRAEAAQVLANAIAAMVR